VEKRGKTKKGIANAYKKERVKSSLKEGGGPRTIGKKRTSPHFISKLLIAVEELACSARASPKRAKKRPRQTPTSKGKKRVFTPDAGGGKRGGIGLRTSAGENKSLEKRTGREIHLISLNNKGG